MQHTCRDWKHTQNVLQDFKRTLRGWRNQYSESINYQNKCIRILEMYFSCELKAPLEVCLFLISIFIESKKLVRTSKVLEAEAEYKFWHSAEEGKVGEGTKKQKAIKCNGNCDAVAHTRQKHLCRDYKTKLETGMTYSLCFPQASSSFGLLIGALLMTSCLMLQRFGDSSLES